VRRLSIIIPSFNEVDRIGQTLTYIRNYLATQTYEVEVLVIDDGSTDGTSAVVDSLRWPATSVLRLDRNRGKGYAVGYGMQHADAEYMLFCDADNATPFEQIERFWPVIERADVVIGSRYVEGSEIVLRQPFIRRLGARVGNALVRLLLLPEWKDTQCGFKLFRRDAARAIFAKQTIFGWGFDIEVLHIASCLGLEVAQVPVDWFDGRGSKVHSAGTFLAVFLELLTIKWRSAMGSYRRPAP
jgi:dolichyl-phosphate beta-glucosyltransferase